MYLAQFNIARLLAPIDDPATADFAMNLDRINGLAEAAPGFVWRLAAEDEPSTHPYADKTIVVTMSVWESRQAFFDFTYRSVHLDFLRRRGEWFEHMEAPASVMWWIPEGHIPTVEEGKERLELLRVRGATPEAFTFREHFEPEPAR
ncbi:DUF3291 domain-containing protein [Actinocorallia sp. B10E7]|uniref:DUF3291 domain-containing protein n=1 Tax=Actinocorallia sp. B10E7 TaxID=3153558 RepID=UPI00325CCCFB